MLHLPSTIQSLLHSMHERFANAYDDVVCFQPSCASALWGISSFAPLQLSDMLLRTVSSTILALTYLCLDSGCSLMFALLGKDEVGKIHSRASDTRV